MMDAHLSPTEEIVSESMTIIGELSSITYSRGIRMCNHTHVVQNDETELY